MLAALPESPHNSPDAAACMAMTPLSSLMSCSQLGQMTWSTPFRSVPFMPLILARGHDSGASGAPEGMSTHLLADRQHESAPVSLPLAIITVGEMGVVIASLDGDDFPPAPFAPPWSRADFGTLLDALTEHRTRTIRIEVRESDGSVFTDIIKAQRPTTTPAPAAEAPDPSATRRARRGRSPRLVEVTASGFIPGEDITVAITVTGTEGDGRGNARAVIDLDLITDHVTEAVFIGDISGHVQTVKIS